MQRAFYSDTIAGFLDKSEIEILGILARNNQFGLELTQRGAWEEQIAILQQVLLPYRSQGSIYFEYSIPRLGKRIDAIVLIGPVIFVLEFKVGEKEIKAGALDQVWDYALDLKNFHETSHDEFVSPVLIATKANGVVGRIKATLAQDKVMSPSAANAETLSEVIRDVLSRLNGPPIDAGRWEQGRYSPTPTIIEAATSLYKNHSVAEISRNDAEVTNLTRTSKVISDIIAKSREQNQKSICFVTGVPGAGKTLVGLDVATRYLENNHDSRSVFLSGNGPLVRILREALARDNVEHEKARGRKITLKQARSTVGAFIQNVHHFRDECLIDVNRSPIDHVAIFDEAQRAWNLEQTSSFMRREKNRPNFDHSEPEFLISCLDRHKDWAVIICLVGGGQEINTGEAGISEWVESLNRLFPHWHTYISSRLTDSEYSAADALKRIKMRVETIARDELHLDVCLRSFRSERVSDWVKQVLDRDEAAARRTLQQVTVHYPVFITRDLSTAKAWLKDHARASERYGIVASSEAVRLKPYAIDVKSPTDPVHWFLDGKDDVRSSYYLESVATQFDVQGLELDWVCVAWDGDLRYTSEGWEYWSFCGTSWDRMKSTTRKTYLLNAYRVLLTRARQGMVIFIPEGDPADETRRPQYYDGTFDYLRGLGIREL